MAVEDTYIYPQTTGIGIPTQVTLRGTDVSLVAGNQYALRMSLSANTPISVYATVRDIAGGDLFQLFNGTVTWVSRNYTPSAAQAGDIEESYPYGRCTQKRPYVGVEQFEAVANVSSGVVTAVAVGEALIEASVPAFDNGGTHPESTGKVYATLLVTVVA